MASPPRAPDDAAILALMAEMDALRVQQQQQSWELQAKLGVLSGSELDSLMRPEMPASLHAAWVTETVDLAVDSSKQNRVQPQRAPIRSAQF